METIDERFPIEMTKSFVHLDSNNSKSRIRSNLESTRDSFHYISDRYKKHGYIYKIIDKMITYPQLIISIIISFMSGFDTYSDRSTDTSKKIFILSVCVSIITASCTFFNFNSKAISYHLISGQYENIYISLKAWLLLDRNRSELISKLQEIKTTQIIISDHDLSLCC